MCEEDSGEREQADSQHHERKDVFPIESSFALVIARREGSANEAIAGVFCSKGCSFHARK